LVANVIGLINAGQETTTCLLANGMLALFTHPEEWDRLRAQPGLWETAIDEFLRYESPAQFVARRVESPITICGFTLDRGAFVSVGLGAANRDPAVFTDPDRLDIGRKEGRILAFGFGPHFCVGSALAHLEASVFFHEIETRYPKLQLAVSPAEIEWRHTVSFRSPLTLPVVTR